MVARFLQFGAYSPDAPEVEIVGRGVARLHDVDGAVPRVSGSYAPIYGLVSTDDNSISDVLEAGDVEHIVGAGERNNNGTVHVFAASREGLYLRRQAERDWYNVTPAAGYTISNDPRRWEFAAYGPRMLAVNINHGVKIQSHFGGSGVDFADVAASAPNGSTIAVVRQFVAVAATQDPTDGYEQSRVWWSPEDNPAGTWSTPAAPDISAQSDWQDIPDAGRIYRIIPGVGGADAIIIGESQILRMNYEGPPLIFRFDVAENNRGTVTPGSVVAVGDVLYYLGHDGFQVFDGATSYPIGQDSVDRMFEADNDWDEWHVNRFFMNAGVDTAARVIYWAYCNDDTVRNNTLLAYNWATKEWGKATSYRADVFTRYRERTATGDTTTRHRLGVIGSALQLATFDGATEAATFETKWQLIPDKTHVFVSRVWPLVNRTAGSEPDITVTTTNSLQGTTTTTTQRTTLESDLGAPIRKTGQMFKVKVDMLATATWTDMQGVFVEIEPQGDKRKAS